MIVSSGTAAVISILSATMQTVWLLLLSHAALPDAGYVAAVLQQADWWGEDLTAIPGFSQAVTAHLARIGAIGVRAHIREMVNEL